LELIVPNKRLHSERSITLSTIMQSVSPSGEPQAVRWLFVICRTVLKGYL